MFVGLRHDRFLRRIQTFFDFRISTFAIENRFPVFAHDDLKENFVRSTSKRRRSFVTHRHPFAIVVEIQNVQQLVRFVFALQTHGDAALRSALIEGKRKSVSFEFETTLHRRRSRRFERLKPTRFHRAIELDTWFCRPFLRAWPCDRVPKVWRTCARPCRPSWSCRAFSGRTIRNRRLSLRIRSLLISKRSEKLIFRLSQGENKFTSTSWTSFPASS